MLDLRKHKHHFIPLANKRNGRTRETTAKSTFTLVFFDSPPWGKPKDTKQFLGDDGSNTRQEQSQGLLPFPLLQSHGLDSTERKGPAATFGRWGSTGCQIGERGMLLHLLGYEVEGEERIHFSPEC